MTPCKSQSTTDISLIYGLKVIQLDTSARSLLCTSSAHRPTARPQTHFKWVSKHSNFYIPLIGWNMAFNDYVSIKRGDK